MPAARAARSARRATKLRALHVDAFNAQLSRKRQLVVGLPGAAEGETRVRQHLAHMR